MAVFASLRDEVTAFDARPLGLAFDVPLFFLQGELDAYTVSSEVETYAAQLGGAGAWLVSIEGGGHSSYFMRDRFLDLLDTYVRPVALARAMRSPTGA